MKVQHTAVAATLAPFDYSGMAADVESEARSVVERVRTRTRATILDTGRELLGIKDKLEHGLFIRWVGSELGMNPRTAQNYMQAAAAFGDKSEIISHLPPTTIYALSAPSVPVSVRKEVVQRLEAGERISPTDLTSIAKRESEKTAKTSSRRARNDWMVEHALKKLPLKDRKALDTPDKRKAKAHELMEQTRERDRAKAAQSIRAQNERDFREARASDEIADLLADRLSSEDAQQLVQLFDLAGERCAQRIKSRLLSLTRRG